MTPPNLRPACQPFQPWPDPKPVSDLLAPGLHGGIFLVGWYGTPQMVRAVLSVFLAPLHDGTTHEWMALIPDLKDPKSGSAKRITPDIYWPCPTNAAWPRRPEGKGA